MATHLPACSSASCCANEAESCSCIQPCMSSSPEDQWNETEHELTRRLDIMQSTRRLTPDGRRVLEQATRTMIDTQAVEIVGPEMYAGFEKAARRRVPRDPKDWPVVALALLLDAAILTGDNDFLGCGCQPGPFEILRGQLEGSDPT